MKIGSLLRRIPLKSRLASIAATRPLGEAFSKIVMFDGKNVWVAHPLLAEEILRQHLQPSESELPEAWRANLGTFCIQFIKEIAIEGLQESRTVTDLLTDLCIERAARQDSATPQQFSELLNDLRSTESQRRILETLCEHFPDNAHFWNHLGRHISICGSGSFSEAEAKLLIAIEIDPRDDVHRHALGMVYRHEVKRLLQNPLSGNETIASRLNIVKPIFTQAEECFAKARELNPDSQYPVVTPIQMIIETFERLARLGGRHISYQAFLNSPDLVGEWCRAKIMAAQDLLSVLYHQEANSDPSPYRVTCDSRLQGILGNFEGMVRGLTELLGRPDVTRVPIRRMLANAYVQQIDSVINQLQKLRRVVELMEENLADNPSSGHDIRIWFRAYRMLPDFTLTRALEQMTEWHLASDDIDAKYYLYILNFIAARENFPRSAQKAQQYIELCRRQAPVLQSKKSFEWWAARELRRPCPLVHHSELGRWSKERDFFVNGVDKLGLIEGRIDQIDSPRSGILDISGMPAFFAPRSQFYRGRDLNASVTCYLGFSYEGLRAWNVRRIAT
jgi:tetratricopeptide (TPR) repeat protein